MLPVSHFPSQVGPAILRNEGIKIACINQNTDIILFDSDICLSQQSLSNLLDKYLTFDLSVIFPIIRAEGSSIFDLYYDLNGILNGRKMNSINSNQISRLLFGTTCTAIINQGIFKENPQLFDPYYNIAGGEDIDFCIDLLFRGIELTGLDNVIIKHCYNLGNDELNDFKNRFERYGKGDAILLKKHPYFYDWLESSHPRI